MRGGPWPRLRSQLGLESQRRFAGASIDEGNGNAAVGFGQDLRRHVRAHQFVASREDDFVSFDAKRPIEDDGVAIAVIALRVFIGLEDKHSTLSVGRYWPRQRNPDEIGVCIGV